MAQPETVQHAHQAVRAKTGAEDHPMSSLATRAHTIPPLVSRSLPQSDVKEVPASAQRNAKRTSSMCEERANQPGMEACLDTAGECCDCDAGEVLGQNVTVAGIRSDTTQMQKCEMFKRRREYENLSTETHQHENVSEAKRDEVQSRVVTHKYADAMLAPEHYASNPRTWALRSVISRMMSKCRTCQLASCDSLPAFFHDWLERGVQAESLKALGLSDGWRWCQVRALQLPSPGVSIQRSARSTHMTPDTKHVENLAGPPEVQRFETKFPSRWPW